MFCGVEEPIAPNEWLYCIDDKGTGGKLANFSSDRVNRYTFLPTRRELAANSMRDVIVRLTESLGTPRWIVAWPRDGLGTHLKRRSAVLKARLLKRGWSLCCDEICVAQKSIESELVSMEGPMIDEHGLGGWTLQFGKELSLEFLLEGAMRSTTRILGEWRRLEPSSSFLNRLCELDWSFAYAIGNDNGIKGLVLVSASRLDIPRVLGDLAAEVLSGTRALSKWSGCV